MKHLKGNLLLLTASFIWGTAIVANKLGMNSVGPFTFNGVRMLIGSLMLAPAALIALLRSGGKSGTEAPKRSGKTLFWASLCCGFFLFAASTMQQIGLVFTNPGKSAFITVMYVVFVPVFGIFLRKKVRLTIWFSVGLSVIGLYFLCVTKGFSVEIGDVITLIGAVMYAFHILCVDHFSPKVDGVALSCLQFLAVGLFSLIPMFFREGIPAVSSLKSALIPLLYAGILSCGIGFTFQVMGQKYTDPTVASILLCLESVFAVLAAIVVLRQIPTLNETLGSILLFIAIILSQLPEGKGLRIGKKKKT